MNWFERGGEAYARFRPEYPAVLAERLAALAPSRRFAVDVGCGTGHLTAHLAPLFTSVLGVDPSLDQLENAEPRENVRFEQSPAEQLPVDDGGTSLITAAQAAHWFDLPAFYDEVRRVAEPGGVLALISYGALRLPPQLAERFDHFYSAEIGPFWPPERRLVDDGYRSIDFPFDEVTIESLAIDKQLTLDELLGYVSTWSAARHAIKAGRQDLLAAFGRELAELWGDPTVAQPVSWPINSRVGVVR